MPLEIGCESVFCLDFTRQHEDFIPFEVTIPELIYRKCESEKVAISFDAEKLDLNFGKLKKETECLAAGLLTVGLKANDRILIAGYNHSQLITVALAASRAGLVFSLTSPNFTHADHLRHLLTSVRGGFRAVVLFSPTADGNSDYCNQLMLAICPELKMCPRGKTKCKTLPNLTHVILADEDHRHAGTFALSDLYNTNRERLAKLPLYQQWNPHKLAVVQFTMGLTGPPKAVGLTHYQLVNGCRIAASAIGIERNTILCCALPLFRIPVFCLAVFTPFLVESRSVFSEPSPLPRHLFGSVNKFCCTTLLSNAAALRLLVRTAKMVHRVPLPTVRSVILLGERVTAELLTPINGVMPNAQRIAVGMLSTEVGAIPLLSDNTTNLLRSMGKPLDDAYEIDVVKVDKLSTIIQNGVKRTVGELRFRPLPKTKFVGYGPNFSAYADWINTGDVVAIDNCGNVELIAYKSDLIYDRHDRLVEHWKMERAMAQYEAVKGVQVVQVCAGAPVVAVLVPKTSADGRCANGSAVSADCFRPDLSLICRENNVIIPEQFAVIPDFPRIGARIQKFKIRELLKAKLLPTF